MTKTRLYRTLINTRREMADLIDIAKERCSKFEIDIYNDRLKDLDNLLEEVHKLPGDFKWDEDKNKETVAP